MDRPFRFLHAADLHLERPAGGLSEVPDALRAALGEAPYRAAERIFDAAIKQQVDFAILSGDVVDPLLAPPRALVFLNEQFGRLADHGIQVYWAGGEADRFEHFGELWELPKNVVRFPLHRVERIVHRREGEPLVEILGTSNAERKTIDPAEFAGDRGELFTVAATCGTIDYQELSRHGVHYWALGGGHVRHTLAAGAVTIHDCGTPQGRGPHEAGPHGCTLVQLDETRRVRTTFIPTDAVRYLDERVTLDASTTYEQLHEILAHRLGELLVDPFGPELLVRWTLSGSRALADRLRTPKWSTELISRLRAEHGAKRPGAWTIGINTAEAADVPEALYDEQTLLGEFLRTARHLGEHVEEPLPLAEFLPPRYAAGRLAGLATIDDAAQRRRVLADAAALGVDLLGPREAGS